MSLPLPLKIHRSGLVEQRARLQDAYDRNAEAMAFLNKVYDQQKAQQAAQERDEPAEDAVFAVDIAPDLKLGQVDPRRGRLDPVVAATTSVRHASPVPICACPADIRFWSRSIAPTPCGSGLMDGSSIQSPRTQRKPMMLTRIDGTYPTRFAARTTAVSLLFQAPPRTTRHLAVSAPRGFVAEVPA